MDQATQQGGKPFIVECETDSDLRDTEQVPMLEEISADILAIEKEAEGLVDGLLVTRASA